jgi:tetratricopeptide (TPR) repeat protein
VVCTETYQRRAEGREDPPTGAGASWEGAIVRLDLYEANGRNRKFIPVLMRGEDKIHRPFFLRDYSYFLATSRDGYAKLCQVVMGDSSKPNVGSAIWNIPPSNPNFFGREQYLENLHNLLTTGGQPAALTQAIKGLGGIGKTHTALKYADQYRDEYSAGFWAVADSPENLVFGFAEFARILDLPERNEKEISKAAAAAKRWFEAKSESNAPWLLILDNVDDWEAVKAWIPTTKTGHVLITTRLQFTGRFARDLDLPKMTADEGAEFLSKCGKIGHPTDLDLSAAKSIAREMDGLPLGLEQAAAYIEEASLSPGEYLELYRREGKKLRARPAASVDHETVTRTFTLAFEKLGLRAGEIVRMASFLAPDAIPEDILAEGNQPDSEFRDAVANAARYSLIRRSPATRTIDIHRLVQDVAKDTMDAVSMRSCVERVAEYLAGSFPEEIEFGTWSLCDRLVPHARVVAAELLRLSIESAGVALLLNQAGWYLDDRAQYKEAEPLYKRALDIREKVLGPDHPDTARSLNNLASLYSSQGQYKEAEPLNRRALKINEKALGPDHPDTATSLNNLAALYGCQGKYREAEPLYKRALDIRERAVGPNHPDTALGLNNLASLYSSQGRYTEAERLLHRALEINEKALGPDHPGGAPTLNNLAEVYRYQGHYKEAEPLSRRALDIREKAFGPDHPDTAMALNNLAGIVRDQGRYTEAELLAKRALEIREKALGPDHPDTAATLNNLAGIYRGQGQYNEAEPLSKRALDIRERALGPNHPNTAQSLNNLASLYQSQGRHQEAEPLWKRALQINETALGPDHPDTAESLNNLATLYASQGKFLHAAPLLARALSQLEKTVGAEHPHVAKLAENYAGVLQKLGRGFDAAKVRKRFKLKAKR